MCTESIIWKAIIATLYDGNINNPEIDRLLGINESFIRKVL